MLIHWKKIFTTEDYTKILAIMSKAPCVFLFLVSTAYGWDMSQLRQSLNLLKESYGFNSENKSVKAKAADGKARKILSKIFHNGKRLKNPKDCLFYKPESSSSGFYLRCPPVEGSASETEQVSDIYFSVDKEKTQRSLLKVFEDIEDSGGYHVEFEPSCFRGKCYFTTFGAYGVDVPIKIKVLNRVP